MKSLKIIITTILCSALAASAWTGVGTQGQGIQAGDRSPFLNALGGTTAGKALFQMANPGAISFLRVNADNTVSALNAADFKTAIGATSSAWGSITGTLASQTDLNSALALKAPLASPALTGTPTINGTAIGTAATTAASAYATAAQGTKADSAIQPTSLVAASIISKTGATTQYVATSNTDAARGVALTNAILAVTAGQTLVCSPGDYYMATTNLLIVDSVTYLWNGARLYIDGSSTGRSGGEAAIATALFTTGYQVAPLNVSKWKFIGPLTLDGGNISTRTGMFITGNSEVVIDNVRFEKWTLSGFNPFSSTGAGNRLSNCYFTGNAVGAYFNAEYWQIVNCTATANTTGFLVGGGNLYFANCSSTYNSAYGLKIMNSSNAAHGSWVGGGINHHQSAAIGVYMDPAITNAGFTFTGVMFYETSFDVNGYGIEVNGGDISGTTIVCSAGTPVNTSHFRNCKYRSESNTFETSLAALTAAKRAKIKILGWRDASDALPAFCDAGDFIPQSYTTTARDALTEVSAGTIIRNTTTSKLNFYTGSVWEAITSAP